MSLTTTSTKKTQTRQLEFSFVDEISAEEAKLWALSPASRGWVVTTILVTDWIEQAHRRLELLHLCPWYHWNDPDVWNYDADNLIYLKAQLINPHRVDPTTVTVMPIRGTAYAEAI